MYLEITYILLQTKFGLDGICVRSNRWHGSKSSLLLVEARRRGNYRDGADLCFDLHAGTTRSVAIIIIFQTGGNATVGQRIDRDKDAWSD